MAKSSKTTAPKTGSCWSVSQQELRNRSRHACSPLQARQPGSHTLCPRHRRPPCPCPCRCPCPCSPRPREVPAPPRSRSRRGKWSPCLSLVTPNSVRQTDNNKRREISITLNQAQSWNSIPGPFVEEAFSRNSRICLYPAGGSCLYNNQSSLASSLMMKGADVEFPHFAAVIL